MGAGDKLFIFCIQRSTAIVLVLCGLVFLQSLGARGKLKNEDDFYEIRSILQYPRKSKLLGKMQI